MAITKPPEPGPSESGKAISAEADDWLRQFIKHFELHVLDAIHDLPPGANTTGFQAATARAILATFLDAGMEFEAIIELFGQIAAERRFATVDWSDALNQRRFILIDKEIQGTLTPSEGIELAGLTRIMRDQVESEENLPMTGARALHRKLLQLDSTGETH